LSGVPFLSSPPEVVKRMLEVARVGPDDVVYDLGCGDGRILITAVEGFRAKEAVGYEIREDVYRKALEEVANANLCDRVRIIQGDFFEANLSTASVITVYLNSYAHEKLKLKLEKEALAGTRIVSHDFPMPGWRPAIEDTFQSDCGTHTIYLYMARMSASSDKPSSRTRL
jgi:16S rRNA A1518/A1519 N6-dimethyltransferase RsmA/KsgA/DIM1 with predicted DNA glycosylase/AP lyase activity